MTAKSVRILLTLTVLLFGASQVMAQEKSACRILCAPEFGVDPSMTFDNVFGAARVLTPDGTTAREPSEVNFEVTLSVDLPTRRSWLAFTIEANLQPFDSESTPGLEFETNVTWLPSTRTRGWLTSHVDLVDDFSPAERPTDRRAYTHKLNFEFAAEVAIFNWLAGDRWAKGIELEASLDYVATGLARQGDVIEGVRFIDSASPWSFSLVVDVPIAPF
jgi:hypothetical protein